MNVFDEIAQAEDKQALREIHAQWYGNAKVRRAVHGRWAELEAREQMIARLLGEAR